MTKVMDPPSAESEEKSLSKEDQAALDPIENTEVVCRRCIKEEKSLEKMFTQYYSVQDERTSSPVPAFYQSREHGQFEELYQRHLRNPEAYIEFFWQVQCIPSKYPVRGLNVIPFGVVTGNCMTPEKRELRRQIEEEEQMEPVTVDKIIKEKWSPKKCFNHLMRTVSKWFKRKKSRKSRRRVRVVKPEIKIPKNKIIDDNTVKCDKCGQPDYSDDEDDYGKYKYRPLRFVEECDPAYCDCLTERHLMDETIVLFGPRDRHGLEDIEEDPYIAWLWSFY